jgi:diaminopimelate decarboxylase
MHPVKAEEAIAEAYFDYGVKTFSLDTIEELEKIQRATRNRQRPQPAGRAARLVRSFEAQPGLQVRRRAA